MAEVSLKPQLRFPEFEKEWKEKRLSDLGEYYGGGTPDTNIKEYWEGNIPWISSSDIFETSIHEIKKTRFITKKAINESASKLIPKGSVLMVSRVGVGKFAVADEDLCTSQDFTSLITNLNSYFLAYYFKTKSNRFINLSQGTSIKGFTTKDIKNAKFHIPLPPEQQKIASFLTVVDTRISLLSHKKEKLELYKKGVMQKIFNQEIRFKDAHGNSFPDWEEKILGEIGATFNGLTGKSKEDFGEGKPYIQYMQIFSSSKIKIEQFGFVEINDGDKQNRVQKGDVFFTTSSETPKEIGTASVLLEDVGEVYLNSFCFGFRPNSINDLIPKFSQYLFRSKKVRKKIIKLAQGSTRYNMSKIELLKLSIEIPNSNEQQKIATFLSALDVKIEAVEKQIEGMKQWKQGLLQKMFI